jgi:hypothetical protein
MKPYGVTIEEWPDVADIQGMGSKSSTGRNSRKSGDYHSYIRGSEKKAAIRRYWKKAARRAGNDEIRQVLED